MLNKITLVIACFLLSSNLLSAAEFTGGKPLDPQPEAAAIKPGLGVKYFFKYFDHIRELDNRSGGKVGEPIEQLNHVSFEDGKVLTSNKPMGVGAHIRGMIHLEQAGQYVFRLQSNDGVKFAIGGIELHVDPEIHAARWSPDLVYQVDTPGWYDFFLNYYQRKGTAALRLKWTPPGGGKSTVVPADAFAHQPVE